MRTDKLKMKLSPVHFHFSTQTPFCGCSVFTSNYKPMQLMYGRKPPRRSLSRFEVPSVVFGKLSCSFAWESLRFKMCAWCFGQSLSFDRSCKKKKKKKRTCIRHSQQLAWPFRQRKWHLTLKYSGTNWPNESLSVLFSQLLECQFQLQWKKDEKVLSVLENFFLSWLNQRSQKQSQGKVYSSHWRLSSKEWNGEAISVFVNLSDVSYFTHVLFIATSRNRVLQAQLSMRTDLGN